MKLEAESYGLGFTLGGAYQINDLVSISLAGRYISAKRELQASVEQSIPLKSATADAKLDATGWGGVIGLDFFPNEWLTIGLTYQSQIALDYDVSHESGTNTAGANVLNGIGLTDGGTTRSDLPALFGTGVNVKLSDRWRYEVSFRYYFNKAADLGKASDGSDLTEKISNSIEFGIGAEYKFTPKFKGSFGYLYSSVGGNVQHMTPELPELDANTFAGGVAWEVVKDLNLQFAGGLATYQGETTENGAISYDRQVPFLAFGIEYTF